MEDSVYFATDTAVYVLQNGNAEPIYTPPENAYITKMAVGPQGILLCEMRANEADMEYRLKRLGLEGGMELSVEAGGLAQYGDGIDFEELCDMVAVDGGYLLLFDRAVLACSEELEYSFYIAPEKEYCVSLTTGQGKAQLWTRKVGGGGETLWEVDLEGKKLTNALPLEHTEGYMADAPEGYRAAVLEADGL